MKKLLTILVIFTPLFSVYAVGLNQTPIYLKPIVVTQPGLMCGTILADGFYIQISPTIFISTVWLGAIILLFSIVFYRSKKHRSE